MFNPTLLLLCFLIAPGFMLPGASQNLTTYNYSVVDGLPSSEVYEVFQDSKGFLWFGTDNGVCRFDGRDFEFFHVKDGLSDPVVFGISEDPRGRIWFRTYSGKVSYFENERIHQFKHNAVLGAICKDQIMLSLYCDSMDRLWFAAGPYIGNISDDGKVDTTYIPHNTVKIVEVEGKKLLSFFGSTDILNKLHYKDKKFNFRQPDTLVYYHVLCAESWNNELYFSINNNLFRLRKEKIEKILTGKAPIISLNLDKENNLWIGYLNRGAERFGQHNHKPEVSLFPGKSITRILHDHEGGVWFTSLENGTYYVPNLAVRNLMPFASSKVTAVVSQNELITIGDISGNVTVFDAARDKILWKRKFDQPIVSLYNSRSEDLWVSTTQNLSVFDRNFRLKNAANGSLALISENRPGTVLGFKGTRISVFDESGKRLYNHQTSVLHRAVFVDDSIIYLAGRSGFYALRSNLHPIKNFPQFDNVKISDIQNLNDSTLIIATNGSGYFIFDKKSGSQTQFNSTSNFNADNIYAVHVGDSLVSLATEKGIAVTCLKSQLAGTPKFNFITRQTGLLEGKISFLAAMKDTLLAFTDHGISVLPLTSIQYANKKPIFILKRITVGDKVIRQPLPEEFSHLENNISFHYSLVSFNNPDILTRYRVTPDDIWIYSNVRNILFSSLAPGAYKFELEYSADNINWEPAFTPRRFNVNPPWWNRWYSQVSGFILLIVVGYFYFKYQRAIYRQKNHYLQIINDHQQKLLQSEIVTLERERNRISKELHDRVGTNLTAIKLMVSQLLKSHREPTAPDVEEQFQIAIREIKEIIYGLTPPSLERYGLFTGLKNYIGKLNKSIPINISLKTFGREINKYEMNIILFRVLQELIANSIKHSFAKNVTIHLNSFEDILNIVYEDDGIGFSYDPLQGGLGLDSIESRINSLGGSSRFDSGEFGISYTIDIPINLNKEAV